MKLSVILAIATLVAPSLSFAQEPPPPPPPPPSPLSANSDDVAASLMVCFYNDAQQFTGAESAQPGEQSGNPTQTGQAGDQAWRWVLVGKDASFCPRFIFK